MAIGDAIVGLYNKYYVRRLVDGKKHANCSFFVLDLEHDRYAVAALEGYATSCEKRFPTLARELRQKAHVARMNWREKEKAGLDDGDNR